MFGGGGIGALFGGKKPRDGAGASSPASGRARASPGVGANPGTAASPNRHRFGPASPPSGASPGREIADGNLLELNEIGTGQQQKDHQYDWSSS